MLLAATKTEATAAAALPLEVLEAVQQPVTSFSVVTSRGETDSLMVSPGRSQQGVSKATRPCLQPCSRVKKAEECVLSLQTPSQQSTIIPIAPLEEDLGYANGYISHKYIL